MVYRGHNPEVARSLLQALEREKEHRLATRPPVFRDRKAVGYAAVGGGGVWLNCLLLFWGGASAAQGTVLLAGGFAVAVVVAWCVRRLPSDCEAVMHADIARERRTAAALEALPLGWTVLHDRQLPGTGHRIAHIAIGPSGIALANPIPHNGPIWATPTGEPVAGAVPLTDWFSTRLWQASTLYGQLQDRAVPIGFDDQLVHAVAVYAPNPAPLLKRLRDPEGAALYALPDANYRTTVAAAPALGEVIRRWRDPFDPVQAAQLAAVVDELCPPAGARTCSHSGS